MHIFRSAKGMRNKGYLNMYLSNGLEWLSISFREIVARLSISARFFYVSWQWTFTSYKKNYTQKEEQTLVEIALKGTKKHVEKCSGGGDAFFLFFFSVENCAKKYCPPPPYT